MNATAVVSCPQCLRQYEIDPSAERMVAQCGGCKAHFAVVIPRLTGPADDALLLEREIEPHTSFFTDACEAMARNVGDLIQLAGGDITADNVLKIVQSLPLSPRDIGSENWREGVLNRVLELLFNRQLNESENKRRQELFEYFLRYTPGRSYWSLDMLQAAFAGVINGIDWSKTVRENIVVIPEASKKAGCKRFTWWDRKKKQKEHFWTAIAQ